MNQTALNNEYRKDQLIRVLYCSSIFYVKSQTSHMTNEDTDVTNDLKPLSVHTATRRNRTLQLSHARSKT